MNATRRINRIPPKGPAHAYKTYAIRSPLETHYRKATCAEVACTAYLEGWVMDKAALVDSGLFTMVKHAGRRYREMDAGNKTVLVFEPGQVCFRASTHRISLERPEFFYVGRGDHRLFNVRKASQHSSAEDFVDDWANHMDRVITFRNERVG